MFLCVFLEFKSVCVLQSINTYIMCVFLFVCFYLLNLRSPGRDMGKQSVPSGAPYTSSSYEMTIMGIAYKLGRFDESDHQMSLQTRCRACCSEERLYRGVRACARARVYVCQSKSSPDWLRLQRGHLMHSVNRRTLDMYPSSGRRSSAALATGARAQHVH